MNTYEEFKKAWDTLVEEHGTGDDLALAIWNAMNESDDEDFQEPELQGDDLDSDDGTMFE